MVPSKGCHWGNAPIRGDISTRQNQRKPSNLWGRSQECRHRRRRPLINIWCPHVKRYRRDLKNPARPLKTQSNHERDGDNRKSCQTFGKVVKIRMTCIAIDEGTPIEQITLLRGRPTQNISCPPQTPSHGHARMAVMIYRLKDCNSTPRNRLIQVIGRDHNQHTQCRKQYQYRVFITSDVL